MNYESMAQCPVCRVALASGDVEREVRRDAYRVACPRCGPYTVTGTLLRSVGPGDVGGEDHYILSGYIRRVTDANPDANVVLKDSEQVRCIIHAENVPTTPLEAVDELLRRIRHASSRFDQGMRLHFEHSASLVYARDRAEWHYVFTAARERQWIDAEGSWPDGYNHARLTPPGWERVSELEDLPPAGRLVGPSEEVDALVGRGETDTVEFKSTLRYDIHQGKNDARITHTALKTVGAFMNSKGGTLVIGVDDDGASLGLASDGFPNEDKYALHFWQAVANGLGDSVSTLINTRFEDLGDERVFVVRCDPSAEPVYLDTKVKGVEFLVRAGPASKSLGLREAGEYIARRFSA